MAAPKKATATPAKRRKKVLKRVPEEIVKDAAVSLGRRNVSILVFGLDEFNEMFLHQFMKNLNNRLRFSAFDNNVASRMAATIGRYQHSLGRAEFINPQSVFQAGWADVIVFGTEESFKLYSEGKKLQDLYKEIVVLEKF
ncbi:hypothetical protein DSS3PM1_00012 [Bacteriophage DSS3_PM1]|nr:hypothetical protein DSS3PM1_00012 [Bacteriophage DSS3_PM1]